MTVSDLRRLDDLVVHLKGLVLVRGYRKGQGAEERELAMFSAEIERVQGELARFVSHRRVEGRDAAALDRSSLLRLNA